jgi:hypothetical protein
MTEKRTLALSTRQWRVLLNDNLDVLKGAVQSTETLNSDGLKTFCAQLDDMKMLASAWFQVGAPAPVPTNGSAPVEKKRRGRPPKNAQQVMQ